MLIVSGHLVLDPADRDAHVIASSGAVRLARQAPGCLDFAVSADPVDRNRVNVFERWARTDDRDAFRASGDPDDEPVDFSRIRRLKSNSTSSSAASSTDRFHPHAPAPRTTASATDRHDRVVSCYFPRPRQDSNLRPSD